MTLRLSLIAAVALVAACTSADVQRLGVPAASADKVARINTTIATDGMLFCALNGVVTAVPGINVIGAASDKVADACKAAITLGTAAQAALAVPVPPPVSATDVPVAVVPMPVAAAVAKSVTAPK